MKHLKYIGITFVAVSIAVVGVLTVSRNSVSLPYESAKADFSGGTQIAIQQQRDEAKNAVSWATKAIFSFILPEKR